MNSDVEDDETFKLDLSFAQYEDLESDNYDFTRTTEHETHPIYFSRPQQKNEASFSEKPSRNKRHSRNSHYIEYLRVPASSSKEVTSDNIKSSFSYEPHISYYVDSNANDHEFDSTSNLLSPDKSLEEETCIGTEENCTEYDIPYKVLYEMRTSPRRASYYDPAYEHEIIRDYKDHFSAHTKKQKSYSSADISDFTYKSSPSRSYHQICCHKDIINDQSRNASFSHRKSHKKRNYERDCQAFWRTRNDECRLAMKKHDPNRGIRLKVRSGSIRTNITSDLRNFCNYFNEEKYLSKKKSNFRYHCFSPPGMLMFSLINQ